MPTMRRETGAVTHAAAGEAAFTAAGTAAGDAMGVARIFIAAAFAAQAQAGRLH